MKTKLLRKIRKQYSIVYYPNAKRYEIRHPHSDISMCSLFISGEFTTEYNKTYNEAIKNLMKIVRLHYYKHTRKYKQSLINHKVWYNV